MSEIEALHIWLPSVQTFLERDFAILLPNSKPAAVFLEVSMKLKFEFYNENSRIKFFFDIYMEDNMEYKRKDLSLLSFHHNFKGTAEKKHCLILRVREGVKIGHNNFCAN